MYKSNNSFSNNFKQNSNYKGNNYNPNYKPRFNKPFKARENTYGFNRNEYILATEVRVIDSDGENLGILSTDEARRIATEQELDLVEISANAKPPVCRIVSWDKFRYEVKKKQSEQKQHTTETKVLWIGINSSSGHLDQKIERAIEFTEKRMPVKVEIRAKGGRIPQGKFQEMMDKILEKLKDNVKIDQPPKFEGNRRYTVIFSKK